MTTTAFSDAELLAQARQGDDTAFAELYVRHEHAARRLANSYARAGDPDDLVNEAFRRVLEALHKGMGPTEAFRAYLFVTLRRLAAARIARSRDDPYDEVPEPVRAEAAGSAELDPDERTLVVDAYESLPERWQAVLWLTAVEGRQPRDLAPTLGMSPNAAAALAYRAREKLRQAYLQAHLQTAPRPQCEPHRSRLGAYVRDGLGPRDRGAIASHLDACSSCRGLVAELANVNRLLVRSLFPVFVATGEVAAALAATTTAVTGAAAGAGTGGVLRGAAGVGRRTWSKARSNPTAASAVVGAVLVAALVAGALIASRGDQAALPGSPPPADEEAAPAVTTPPPDDDPEPPDAPLVEPPPPATEPISSTEEAPPASEPPTTVATIPARTPTSPPRPPGTRTVPPTSSPPDPEPPPEVPSTMPPPTEAPTTQPPTTQPPPAAPPALLDITVELWWIQAHITLGLSTGLGLTAEVGG